MVHEEIDMDCGLRQESVPSFGGEMIAQTEAPMNDHRRHSGIHEESSGIGTTKRTYRAAQ